LGENKGLKNPWAKEEDVFLIHPQNDLNSLILTWCIGGCWFTLAMNLVLLMLLKSRVMDLALSLLLVITYNTSSINKFLKSGKSS
jgi:hypothetical protein